MAVNVELITGHGVDNHISSFDMRAYNRGFIGGGKYILEDEEKLAVQVSALTGTIQIGRGSCLWSGMHIRVEEAGTIAYTIPATTDNVYVWLHYIRDALTQVENIDFEVTTSTRPDESLIVDRLNDNMVEAYTLFCSFKHDVATSSAISLSYAFELQSGLENALNVVDDKVTTTLLAVNTQLASNVASVNNSIASLGSGDLLYTTSSIYKPLLVGTLDDLDKYSLVSVIGYSSYNSMQNTGLNAVISGTMPLNIPSGDDATMPIVFVGNRIDSSEDDVRHYRYLISLTKSSSGWSVTSSIGGYHIFKGTLGTFESLPITSDYQFNYLIYGIGKKVE